VGYVTLSEKLAEEVIVGPTKMLIPYSNGHVLRPSNRHVGPYPSKGKPVYVRLQGEAICGSHRHYISQFTLLGEESS